MQVSDGMNYAPKGKPQPVVSPGEFVFSAAHLDHGHIYGMTNALLEAVNLLMTREEFCSLCAEVLEKSET